MRFTCALKTVAIGLALTASGVAYAQGGGGGGNAEEMKRAEAAVRAQENVKVLEGTTAPKLPPATVPASASSVGPPKRHQTPAPSRMIRSTTVAKLSVRLEKLMVRPQRASFASIGNGMGSDRP